MRATRRGMGSILGVVLFFGILFSSIVPLQLFIKQNKVMMIATNNEVQDSDQQRELEDLYFLAYPSNSTSDEVYIKINNQGPTALTVSGLWIKDIKTNLDIDLVPGQEQIFGPYNIELEENSTYPMKLITESGRMFSPDSGYLYFINGTWIIQGFGISIQIANNIGKYYVHVSNSTWSDTYQTIGQDHDDLFVFFAVKTAGEYLVECKKNTSTGPDLPGTPLMVEILYPSGPPVAFVYTSGLDS